MDPSSEIIVETGRCIVTFLFTGIATLVKVHHITQSLWDEIKKLEDRRTGSKRMLCRRMAKKHLKVEEIKGEVQPVLGKVDRISVRGCKPCLKIVPCYRLCRRMAKKHLKKSPVSRNSKDPLLLVREKLNLINELESSSGSRAEWGKTTLACNLNKELESSSLMEFIDIVIWITMSKDFNLRNVQSQRAKRLNLELDANGAIEERAKMLLKD
ncbi:hypothetical protein V6N13_009736 [Hibiscus sabdariffa]|uniref:NB-ARC domain-containing protein n=1 Tax=Hibiscus sabdariffa TaxID=183260 RepID=A0ABR2NNZ4_9ROSI